MLNFQFIMTLIDFLICKDFFIHYNTFTAANDNKFAQSNTIIQFFSISLCKNNI